MRIGRGTNCQLVLDSDGYVSQDHAIVRNDGQGEWLVRDLGSKNGTFLNRRRLVAGDTRLVAGDTVWFGDARSAWVFEPGPPCELLVVRAGCFGEAAPLGELLFALPSTNNPEATFSRRSEQWLLETSASDSTIVVDGQAFSAAGEQYRVWISSRVAPTEEIVSRMRLVDATLRLAGSLDGEEVHGELQVGDGTLPLPVRTYLHLLTALCRFSIEDAAIRVPSGEVGWRYVDEVSRSLELDPQSLNLYVHRARQDVGKLGFENPGAFIQRRSMTKQIRIGIPPDRIVLTNL
jgi:hypothetical protein